MKKLRQKRRVSKPSEPVEYPVGSFIRTEAGYFYISSNVRDNKEHKRRLRFTHKRILDSWNPQRIIETTEAAVQKYTIASKMRFRTGSLIHNLADGKIYLIQENKRRHITNPDVLETLGATLTDVIPVSLEEVLLHELGDELK